MFTNGSDVKTFTLAGHAVLTLTSQRGERNRYTFKVTRARDKGDGKPRPWFVALLTGPDNTSAYTYMGMITPEGDFRLTAKSHFKADSIPVRAFAFFWKHARDERIAPELEVRHMGMCGRCGRALTVPESISTGLGPECADKLGVEWKIYEGRAHENLITDTDPGTPAHRRGGIDPRHCPAASCAGSYRTTLRTARSTTSYRSNSPSRGWSNERP